MAWAIHLYILYIYLERSLYDVRTSIHNYYTKPDLGREENTDLTSSGSLNKSQNNSSEWVESSIGLLAFILTSILSPTLKSEVRPLITQG